MRNRYYKDEFFGNLASDYRNHVVFYNNIEKYYKHIDHKREVVRHFITWIEATINYMTEYLIKAGKQKLSLFDTEDMQQLEANGKGLDFAGNFKFTFKLFATQHDLLPIYNEYIGKYFENLKKIIAIRNNFTHPRKESDLCVSALDFDMANQSYKDYYDFQNKFFEGIFYENRDG